MDNKINMMQIKNIPPKHVNTMGLCREIKRNKIIDSEKKPPKNIPSKHVNAKGSVGRRKKSGYHVMMMQTEHINIRSKHVNAKGSVGGRKRSGYHVMMMQTEHTNIRSKHVNPRVQLKEEKQMDNKINQTKETYHLNMSMARVQLEEEREVDLT